MLHTLRIQNFALIETAELNFNSGFTVITGETGSGKSILLAALNLILGERADFSVIGKTSDKAIVEAEFSIDQFQLTPFFEANDLDFSAQTILRREINTSGKSRAFINDTPVSLVVMKELTSQLVNIHSQYNTLELKNKTYQLEVLDTLADLIPKRTFYLKQFKALQLLNDELSALKISHEKALYEQDFAAFQLEELAELNLEKYAYAELEAELKLAESSEEIISILSAIHGAIDNENAVLSMLRTVKVQLDKLGTTHPALNEINERLKSVIIELGDVSSEAYSLIDQIEIQPQRLLELTEMINKFNHLLKKHHVNDQAELIAVCNQFQSSVSNLEVLGEQITELERQQQVLEKETWNLAKQLHQDRKDASVLISKDLQLILEELKLPNTTLSFDLSERSELSTSGISDIAFLFSANIGIPIVPIEKAASGGELSRVMLALQKMISEKKTLPTVLFDEIDTGVSGDVAQKIGSLLHKMGQHFQLMAISHLPQVAAKAAYHLKVEKEIVANKTATKVIQLTEDESIQEIARLMSGEIITAGAIETAKALKLA
jgi:DNA repair protein RecN (Recombination protein N)